MKEWIALSCVSVALSRCDLARLGDGICILRSTFGFWPRPALHVDISPTVVERYEPGLNSGYTVFAF